MFMLCTEGEGRSKSLIVSSESHQGRLRFSLSLSLFYTRLSSLCYLFFRRRKREARNFRIKIFEPYCFAYIFRFAISSGARLLYTKKQHVPGRMTRQVILRRSFEGFQNGHSVVFAMGHGNGKRQTLEGAIN